MNLKKYYKPLFAACFFLAVLAALLSRLAASLEYDASENYFIQDSPLFLSACISAALSFLCGVAAVFLMPRESLQASPFSQKSVVAPAAVGFAVALGAIATVQIPETLSPFLLVLTVICLAASVGYSILSGISSQTANRPTTVAGFGLTAVLSCLFLNVYYYFDMTLEMNAPMKLFVQLGLLAAMVYYTGELRYLLKKPMPRVFLLTAVAVLSAGSLCAFSVPIVFFLGRLPRFEYLAGAIAVLTIQATVILRTLPLIFPQEPPEKTDSPVFPSNSNDEI